jgi:hypothetical protein
MRSGCASASLKRGTGKRAPRPERLRRFVVLSFLQDTIFYKRHDQNHTSFRQNKGSPMKRARESAWRLARTRRSTFRCSGAPPDACASGHEFATTDCALTWHGITLYGAYDVGVGWVSHGLPEKRH